MEKATKYPVDIFFESVEELGLPAGFISRGENMAPVLQNIARVIRTQAGGTMVRQPHAKISLRDEVKYGANAGSNNLFPASGNGLRLKIGTALPLSNDFLLKAGESRNLTPLAGYNGELTGTEKYMVAEILKNYLLKGMR